MEEFFTGINWLWTMVLIPIIAFTLKNYILEYIEDRKIYKTRMFDDDQNPKTGQDGWILNEAKGIYEINTIEEYTWNHFLPSKREVIVLKYIPEGKIRVKYTYKNWKKKDKGKIINNN